MDESRPAGRVINKKPRRQPGFKKTDNTHMNDTTPTSGVNGRPSNVLSFRGNAAPKAAFGAPAPKATLSDQAFEADFADYLKATEEYAI